MFIAYLSYDVHPLACIRRQVDTSIQYVGDEENRMGRVEFNLSIYLRNFQIAAGIITIVCAIVLLLPLAWFFYCSSYSIIQKMKKELKESDFQ